MTVNEQIKELEDRGFVVVKETIGRRYSRQITMHRVVDGTLRCIVTFGSVVKSEYSEEKGTWVICPTGESTKVSIQPVDGGNENVLW
jgi:hypothetical protein